MKVNRSLGSKIKRAKYNSDYYKKNPRNKIKAREYSWKNQGIKNADGSWFMNHDREVMLAQQKNKCKICKSDAPGSTGWCVDHDHLTGIVRGILCHGCNKGIGLLKESCEVIEAASNYLKRWKNVN